MTDIPCEFCQKPGGILIHEDSICRVVLVDEPRFPGFCRVVSNRHVKEMTDLSGDERAHIMAVVFSVEAALRELVRPDKMNLACLGNVTPHVHWHVIPRWRSDARFPQPVWGEPLRPGVVPSLPKSVDDFVVMLRSRLRLPPLSR